MLQFVDGKNRSNGSSKFGFRKDCTLRIKYEEKYNFDILCSTSYSDDKIDEDSSKPEITIDHNRTKGGDDVVENLCAS